MTELAAIAVLLTPAGLILLLLTGLAIMARVR